MAVFLAFAKGAAVARTPRLALNTHKPTVDGAELI
jgi:hypothetical protein